MNGFERPAPSAGGLGVRIAGAALGGRLLRAGTPLALAAALAACGGGSDGDNRGSVDSVTQTAALSRAVIDASVAANPGFVQLIGAASQCDVTQHKLVYDSIDPRGDGARASAGLYIPSGCPGPYPVLVYHHGTTVDEGFTMSSPQNGEAGLQLAMFAAQGYVVVMPDYHGYGDSTLGWHPYLHADNTAQVSIDALRAARTVLSRNGVATSGRLFLAGYSQGGHAAMATHRAMERDHAGEFTVTAAVPMSGPYALEETFVDGIASPGQGASVFTAMTFTGYQKAYGDLYAKPEDMFQAPWVTGIEDLLPGALGFTELYTTGKLPLATSGPGGLLTEAFVTAFSGNPDFPARKRLRENGLLDWKPAAPVALCGGSRDPTVPFKNVITATGYFGSQGVQVTPVDVEQVPAFQPAIAAQVAAAPDLSTYHGGIVPPLCVSFAKNQFFDPRK